MEVSMRCNPHVRAVLIALSLTSLLRVTQSQNNPATSESLPKPQHHHQYKLIDLGTFGGPASFIFGETGPLNSSGQVTSCADTADIDSYVPNGNPYFGNDPFLQHGFLWNGSVLNDLPPLSRGRASCGQWINDLGVVVGAAEDGSIDSLSGYPAVVATRWKHGKPVPLGSLGGSNSVAWAVNNGGQIAGSAAIEATDNFGPGIFWNDGNQVHATLWHHGTLRDLGTLGGPDSQGFLINDRGEVVGLSYTNYEVNPVTGWPDLRPFLWKDGHMIDLGSLGGGSGSPSAVNNRSEVAGFSNLAGDTTSHPFLWRRGKLLDLGTLGGDNGVANWIGDSGEVVGTADLKDGTHHAFVWRGKMIDIGTVDSDPCSNGVTINSLGQAAGTSTDCRGNVQHLFLWEHGSIVNLSALVRPGADLVFNDPVMINDRGEIAGNGVMPDGTPHAALLVPDGECDDACDARLATAGALTASQVRNHEMTSPLSPAERLRRFARSVY
jgi:probable HAF family extracellular repeat protein